MEATSTRARRPYARAVLGPVEAVLGGWSPPADFRSAIGCRFHSARYCQAEPDRPADSYSRNDAVMASKHRTSSMPPPARWYRGADIPLRLIRRFARQVAERFEPEKI